MNPIEGKLYSPFQREKWNSVIKKNPDSERGLDFEHTTELIWERHNATVAKSDCIDHPTPVLMLQYVPVQIDRLCPTQIDHNYLLTQYCANNCGDHDHHYAA